MYFGIATFPAKEVQDFANSYRKRYDPHYTLIPPHITLKARFELEQEKVNQLTQELERIAKNFHAFTIDLTKVKHFHPTSPTLYLAIEEGSSFLIELHKQIESLFESSQMPYDYIPHLTIGQKMDEEELHDVYSSLRQKRFHLQSTIDRFHLMYQLENQSWTIYQSFLLKNQR